MTFQNILVPIDGSQTSLAVVDKAVEFKLGARGLRSIVETIMMDLMYEVPALDISEFNVTLEYAKKQLDKSNLAVME